MSATTKEKIKQFEISRYKNQYRFFEIPFGSKQERIFADNFELNYSRPKNSTERKSLAWDVWLYKAEIKKLGEK